MHFSGGNAVEIALGSVWNCNDFRRCALSILGRAQNVLDAQGCYIENWNLTTHTVQISHNEQFSSASRYWKLGSKCNPNTLKYNVFFRISVYAIFLGFFTHFRYFMGTMKVPRWFGHKILILKHPWKSKVRPLEQILG